MSEQYESSWFCDKCCTKRRLLENDFSDLKAKYVKAVNCLRRAQKIIRDDFHNSVCLKSMGCHCKDNFIDEVIIELGEKE